MHVEAGQEEETESSAGIGLTRISSGGSTAPVSKSQRAPGGVPSPAAGQENFRDLWSVSGHGSTSYTQAVGNTLKTSLYHGHLETGISVDMPRKFHGFPGHFGTAEETKIDGG